jgi:hypothetical protein
MSRPALVRLRSIEHLLRQVLVVPPLLIAEDFTFVNRKEKSATTVQLLYDGGHGESFTAKIPNEKNSTDRSYPEFKIECVFNPGEITSEERVIVWGADALRECVSAWARRIAEDMGHLPAFRAIREQAARIEDLQSKLDQYPDEMPSKEQVQQLRDLINNVEQTLRERIEQLEVDSKDKQQRLDALSAQFDALRARVESSKVRSILRALTVRAYNVASDPRFGTLLENGGKLVNLLSSGLPGADHK